MPKLQEGKDRSCRSDGRATCAGTLGGSHGREFMSQTFVACMICYFLLDIDMLFNIY